MSESTSSQQGRPSEWVDGERVEVKEYGRFTRELGPELPFRPSVGLPTGWSVVECEEV